MNRRYLFVTIVLFAAVFLLVCSFPAVVNVKVLKPASIHMPGVKEVAIADFQGQNRSGSQIATLTQALIMQTQHFDVMERDKLRQVLDEQNLGMAGIVDASTAAEVGRLLGVDALIFGEVTTYEVEPDKEITTMVKERRGTGKYHWVEEKDKKGKVKKVKKEIMEEVYVPKKHWVRKGTVAINFRVVDVGTGRLLAAHSDSRSYDSANEKRSFFGKPKGLKPEGEILSDLSKTICHRFTRMIAPYYTDEKRTIEPGKGSIGVGVKYAKAGLWPEAMETWKEAVREMPKEPAAMYNLGLALEVQGDLDRAEKAYQAAVRMKQKKLYLEAIARVRKAREDAEKLKEQMEEREDLP